MQDYFDAKAFCDFKTKLQNIAKHLGGGWSRTSEMFGEYLLRGALVNAEGAEVFISYRHGEPWRISGRAPKDYLGGNPTKSINVSFSRDAKAVAAEINRRLLPEYLPFFKEAKKSCDANARREQKIKEAYASFTHLTGNAPDGYTKKIHTDDVDCAYRRATRERKAFIPGVRAIIEVNAQKEDSVKVNLTLETLTVDEATAVLKFLRAGRLEAAAKATIKAVA